MITAPAIGIVAAVTGEIGEDGGTRTRPAAGGEVVMTLKERVGGTTAAAEVTTVGDGTGARLLRE